MQFTMRRLLIFGFGLTLSISQLCAQSSVVPSGATLQVQVERDAAMKPGQLVRGKVVYPLYLYNRVVIPSGEELVGHIVGLQPVPKKERLNARLGGDFTPLHTAQVEFDKLVMPNGRTMSIDAVTTDAGAQVVRFMSAGTEHHASIFKHLWEGALGRGHQTVRTFTAPGKTDRAKRLLYSELPYHPQTLLSGTEYTVTLRQQLELRNGLEAKEKQPHKGIERTVTLAAALQTAISSKDAVPGTKVTAEVVEPVFDANHKLLVPEGSELLGEVTQAQHSGKWGHAGTLRFSFQELRFPAGFSQKVQGSTTGVDADRSANLALDAEGGVKPRPKGIAAPLAMGLLAASALHEDEASVLHTGGASNGFALVGRVLALSLKSTTVGAVIGMYGTSRTVYSRFIAHGEDVKFAKNTRIEVVLEPQRMKVLQPN